MIDKVILIFKFGSNTYVKKNMGRQIFATL